MEIGEHDLAAPHHGHFAGLRLLDLDNHVGPVENLLGAADQFGARLGIVLVGQPGAQAGPRFDQHVMSGAG